MKIKTVIISLLFAAIALTFYGCGGDTETLETVPPLAEQAYPDVRLVVEPDPPVALKDTALIATVTDSLGYPLNGASVVFDLSMPAMYHGENRPAASEVEPGIYKGTGIMTMGGKWLVRVEVTSGGNEIKREFFTMVQGG